MAWVPTISCLARLLSCSGPDSITRNVRSRQSILSPWNGRLKIAQRFIAGKQEFATKSVKRTAEETCLSSIFQRSAPRTAIFFDLIPAVNCWAIVSRPPSADYEQSENMENKSPVRFVREQLNRPPPQISSNCRSGNDDVNLMRVRQNRSPRLVVFNRTGRGQSPETQAVSKRSLLAIRVREKKV
jgi:hypothetical protein